MQTENLFCCKCNTSVAAVRVTGQTIYPHLLRLWDKVFYQCPRCKMYVGTHPDGRPLGSIPTPELRVARHKVHEVVDPLWQSGKIKRWKLYQKITKNFGLKAFHTAEINTVEFAERVIKYVKSLNIL